MKYSLKKFFILFSIFSIFSQLVLSEEEKKREKIYTNLSYDFDRNYGVIVHPDSRMPVVVINVVFRVGRKDAPLNKSGIVEIISENLISRELRIKFLELGIDCFVNSFNEYTEIVAIMHPNNVEKFLKLITTLDENNVTNFITEKNLEIIKKKILIKNKLINYEKSNCIEDSFYSVNYPQLIFNETALQSITLDDIKDFCKKYYSKDRIYLISVYGDYHANDVTKYDASYYLSKILYRLGIYEKVMEDTEGKIMQTASDNSDDIFKVSSSQMDLNKFKYNIRFENKYMENKIIYCYKIGSDRKEKAAAYIFFHILYDELFRNFFKSRSLLRGLNCNLIFGREEGIFYVTMYPKNDVSFEEIKQLYKQLIERISIVGISEENLQKIAEKEEITKKIRDSNLLELQSFVTNAYINDIYNTAISLPTIIKYGNSSGSIRDIPKSVKECAGKIQNQLFEIITQYRADK